MKVLVTGGAGYVGVPVVEELQGAGHDVTVLDSLLHEQANVADVLRSRGVPLIVADVRDAASKTEGTGKRRGCRPSGRHRRGSCVCP